MSVNLFISLYHEQNKERQIELHTCLMNNLKSKCFDQIWIIAEPDKNGKFDYLESIAPYKVNILPCTVRPTFRTFFEVINNVTIESSIAGYGGNINVVANSDIYFESIPIYPKINQCFALCRWEVNKDGTVTFLNRKDAQDVFIFNSKIRIPRYSDCHFGIPGVDNRLCAELLNTGYEMLNPSLTIKTFHLHHGAKSYDGSVRIGRPYHFLPPIEL